MHRVLLALVLLIAGCSGAAPEPVPGPVTVSRDQWRPLVGVPQVQMSPEDMAQARERYLASYAQFLGLNPAPEVAVEQIDYPDQVVPLQQKCLAASGITATVGPDGQLEPDAAATAPGTEGAGVLYTCRARYFTDPRLDLAPTGAQLDLAWDYLARFLVPCLRSRQVTAPDPPAKQDWTAGGGTAWAYPELTDRADRDQIIADCRPQPPPEWYLGDRQP
ncbi:MAG: hypothetical protein Q4G45_04310 [Actinomycetia bacterium]|nr:hypothetical protein [Actinomycetes bacterium]